MLPTGFAIALFSIVLGLSAVMTLAWLVWDRTRNSGWIDAVWTFGLGLVGVTAALAPVSASSVGGRQMLVTALVAVWSIRLGSHIVQRSAGRADDPRYGALVAGWGADARRQMFILLQKQALVSIPLAAAILVAAHAPGPFPRVADVLAVVVAIVAIGGEALADAQLRRFISDRSNRGRVADAGLWAYSRHPNYFFEWLHWVAYPLIALGAGASYGWGWLALGAPMCMYWLLNSVSGIPPLEEHMLRRHGDAYRRYQARTNAFFPGPRRS